MFCRYCTVGKYDEFCTCKKNGQICPFVRRCTRDRVWKPLDSMSKCTLRTEEVKVPKGMNRVRFELHGELYVEVDEFVYSIKNPYDYIPELVELTSINDTWYIKGFEPKPSKKTKPGGKSDENKG